MAPPEAADGRDGGRIAGLRATLDLYWRDGERLRDELAEARAEIAALRASTSWRVTGPLRALSRRLRPR